MASLQQGVVIDVPAWKVPVISRKKYLKQPEIAVNIKFSAEELKAMPDKQFKVFEQQFEKSFTPAFQKMSGTWFADMQKTIDTTEAAIDQMIKAAGSKAKEQGAKLMQTVVDKSNAALMAKCKTWTETVQKLAQAAYDSAFVAALKAMKAKITKAKIKMIAKVVFIVALTLTAAAVTIAVSVVTMGAGAALAPVVIAGILTASKALFGSAGEVLKSYDVLASTIAAVEKDAKNLGGATTALLKAMQKTAGTMDKAKAFKAALSADVQALDKHVGQLDKFVAVAQAKTSSRLKEIQALADKLAGAKKDSKEADTLEKQVLVAQKSFDSAMARLKAIDEVKAAAAEAKVAYGKLSGEAILKAVGRFAPALTLLGNAVTTASQVATPLKTIATGVQKLASAK